MQQGVVGSLTLSTLMNGFAMLDKVTGVETIHAQMVFFQGGDLFFVWQQLEFGTCI